MKDRAVKLLPFVFVPMGLLIYSAALSGPFVFDDVPFIAENAWVHSLGGLWNIGGARYVADLSFALNYAVGGADTFGYHLVNVVVHILNAMLLYALVTHLFETPALKVPGQRDQVRLSRWVAFCCGLIFLVHPLQVQAVTYISQRYTSLAAFFYLASVVLYVRARLAERDTRTGGRLLMAASIVAAVLAMKTKEIAFTLPVLLTLLEYAFFERRGPGRARALAPFYLASLIVPLSILAPEVGLLKSGNPVEELMRQHKLEEASGISRYAYLLTQAGVVLTYLRLLVFPVHGGSAYDFPLKTSISDAGVVMPAFGLAAVAAFGVYVMTRSVRTKDPYGLLAGFGIIWFFIAVSVESSLVPIKDTFNERRSYLPGAGVTLACVAGVFYISGALRARPRVTVALPVALVLAVSLPLMYATYATNLLWADPVALYKSEVAKHPASASYLQYLGIQYAREGRYTEALAPLEKARGLSPSSVLIRRNLAKLYVRLGDIDAAIAETRAVVSAMPESISDRYDLGALYLEKGLLKEAREVFAEALRFDGGNERAMKAVAYIDALMAKQTD